MSRKQLLFALQPYQRRLVWGGTRLAANAADSCETHEVAECLDVSCLPEMSSLVVREDQESVSLAEMFQESPEHFLGHDAPADSSFPFLIKRLDVAQPLSLQVHPGDADAKRLESQPTGKAEVWVVLDADPDAHVWLGVNEGVTAEDVKRGAEDGTLPGLMRKLPVAKGDVIPVPPGCVHGIGPGVLFFEAQQSSDLTYRLFDWGRKDAEGQSRELHLEKALSVADLSLRPEIAEPELQLRGRGMTQWSLDDRGPFRLERWRVTKKITRMIASLSVFFVESGSCVIRTVGGEERVASVGETVMLAASACRVYVDPTPETRLLVVRPVWRTEK